jgi:imidazole glycerol-phosphate synthase subunit HisH
MIQIVDYGMGNLRSVLNALEALGAEARISSSAADLRAAERIVLPGVGAFGEAMARLREAGLVEPLREEVLARGKPFLGICLGMQLLADRGFEHGEHDGLGFIPGEVRRIVPSGAELRVPHIGWNAATARASSPLFRELKDPAFYFVHSFHFVPRDRAHASATSDYGGELVVAVERERVFGVQFHPEKSHKAGLRLLRNFLELPC